MRMVLEKGTKLLLVCCSIVLIVYYMQIMEIYMALPLSLTVITLNEEKNLDRCLSSVCNIVSEIIVVDSGSSDATKDIALKYGAKFIFNAWPGNVEQNHFAFDQSNQPWVLSLDADEELTPELADSIRAALSDPKESEYNGWYVNRRTQYLDEWMWNIWYPEWRLRLVKRANANWIGPDPHGRLDVVGVTKKLDGDLLHYTYKDLNDQFSKLMSYAQISSLKKHKDGKHMSPMKLIFSPWFRFLRDLILKRGWRDGYRGILICYAGAISSFMKQAYLFELEVRDKKDKR